MKTKKEICVLNKDNTFQFINNDDMTILTYAKRNTSKYIFFPVYNKDGVKYYKEDANVIMSSIRMKLNATLLLCDFNDSGVSFRDPVPISLTANNIAETYSLIGSLYTLDYVCESLQTSILHLKPELFEFDILIYVDGYEYHLDHNMYFELSKSMDKSDTTVEEDFNVSIVPIYDIIGYIENTISYKYHKFDVSNNPNFILFPNGQYMEYGKFKKSKIDAPENCAILGSTGSSLYISISYPDLQLLCEKNSRYTFSYVMYEPYGTDDEIDGNSSEYIPDEDLSCHVIMELSGDIYEIGINDDIDVYSDTEFIFLITSINDISEILLLFSDYDYRICFTCGIDVTINTDTGHYHPFIMESITYDMASNKSMDLLCLLTRRIIAIKTNAKEQLS